jgi:hypothetical protein
VTAEEAEVWQWLARTSMQCSQSVHACHLFVEKHFFSTAVVERRKMCGLMAVIGTN